MDDAQRAERRGARWEATMARSLKGTRQILVSDLGFHLLVEGVSAQIYGIYMFFSNRWVNSAFKFVDNWILVSSKWVDCFMVLSYWFH